VHFGPNFTPDLDDLHNHEHELAMTNTFLIVRWSAYAWCIVCAISVLAISAHQASLFIDQWAQRPYIIYALVCSIMTILGLGALCLRSQPRLDVIGIAVFTILWLALGAYTTDIIGYVQCETLVGERKVTDSGGSFSSMAWCRELKAIMAFSYVTFGILLISLIILLALMITLHARGQYGMWRYSMSDVPWFGVYGDREGGIPYPMVPPPAQRQYTGNVVYQQPGHDVIIDGNQIRQVPTGQPVY